MTVQEAINKVIKLAEKQVGYKAGRNKATKYTEYLDSLGDFYNYKKNGYNVDWCDIFYDWLITYSFPECGRQMLYQPKKSTGAGCGFSASFYRQNNAWSKAPQLGAQIFYGTVGNESHTGIVVGVEEKYIWTIEGNTGGGNGEVQKKKVSRASNIAGYGIPNWKLVAVTQKFTPKFGIDISEWQYDYDMAKAQREGIKFVIIRGGGGDGSHGSGIYKDVRFEENYKKAKSLGLPVGVYWFFNAFTENRAKEEAEFFYQNCLKGKQFELPIYIDVEQGVLKQSRRSLTDNTLTWLKYIRAKGYWVGIYASTSCFTSNLYDSEVKSYAHWVADWRDKCYYPNYHGMWQFTDGDGEKTYGGREVDQDWMYEDYEAEIKAKGLNGWGKGTPVTPTPTPKVKLDVDGLLGHNSVVAMQKWVGTYEDGVITGQIKAQSQYYPSLISVKYGSGGSSCIKAIQNLLIKNECSVGGTGADGILGRDTIKGLQKFLNKNGSKLNVDGVLGTSTAKELQKYLNKVVYK